MKIAKTFTILLMKAKTQVIKKENKKAEVKSVKKDIITKVENEAKSDVEQ